MEWLAENSNPMLRLDYADIELTYQAVALQYGPGPDIVTFKAECVMRPGAGAKLIYTTDELSFMPSMFGTFNEDLEAILNGKGQEARLSPIGDELIVTIIRLDQYLRMHIEIKEWQGIYGETTASSSGGVGTDVAFRWVREIREYGDRLAEWMLMFRA